MYIHSPEASSLEASDIPRRSLHVGAAQTFSVHLCPSQQLQWKPHFIKKETEGPDHSYLPQVVGKEEAEFEPGFRIQTGSFPITTVPCFSLWGTNLSPSRWSSTHKGKPPSWLHLDSAMSTRTSEASHPTLGPCFLCSAWCLFSQLHQLR